MLLRGRNISACNIVQLESSVIITKVVFTSYPWHVSTDLLYTKHLA